MENIYFYIDESHDEKNNILLLSLVVVSKDEDLRIRNSATKLKENISIDQYIGIRSKNIKKIFHFTDDKIEVRNKLIDLLRISHYTAYIAYKEISDSYQETYRYLFYKLVKERIKKYSDKFIQIYYEQNPNISHQILEKQINDIQSEFKKTSTTKSVYNIECHVGTKDNVMLAIPDYTLGIYNDYADKNNRNEYARLSFEKLRGKIRLIMDLDNNTYYTRSNII